MASGKRRTQRGRNAAPRPQTQTATAPSTAEATRVRTFTAPARPMSPPAGTTPSAAHDSSADIPVRRTDNVDWSGEYSYVVSDLRQMAIVSVGLFAVMIIIGFFI